MLHFIQLVMHRIKLEPLSWLWLNEGRLLTQDPCNFPTHGHWDGVPQCIFWMCWVFSWNVGKTLCQIKLAHTKGSFVFNVYKRFVVCAWLYKWHCGHVGFLATLLYIDTNGHYITLTRIRITLYGKRLKRLYLEMCSHFNFFA